MKSLRLSALAAAALLGGFGAAQAGNYSEDFSAPFPAWESNWFGTETTAHNYYCQGDSGCATRGNNPDGLWVIGNGPDWSAPVEVDFLGSFAASLTSFQLDVAGYVSTTLRAYDMDNALIFSQVVALTSGAWTDPGVYSTYTITSSNGISRFTFSGEAAGNTSIDNLIATTRSVESIDFKPIVAVPEPETYALFLMGLGAMGFFTRGRRSTR
jgi:hypothetical protein